MLSCGDESNSPKLYIGGGVTLFAEYFTFTDLHIHHPLNASYFTSVPQQKIDYTTEGKHICIFFWILNFRDHR